MDEYRTFKPTPYDSHIPLEDREDWLIIPVSRSRDSAPLSNSNFEVALEMLGGEGDKVEVHRFNHWGPGWFEIIIIHPDLRAVGEEIEEKLENHPALDEVHFAELAREEQENNWSDWAGLRFIDVLADVFGLQEWTQSFLIDHADDLLYYHRQWSPDPDGINFSYVKNYEMPSRENLANMIKEIRRGR